MFQYLREDHSSSLGKRQNWFLKCTRVEKNSNCSSFWKFVCLQSSSVMLESCSTCCVDSQIRQRCLFWGENKCNDVSQ